MGSTLSDRLGCEYDSDGKVDALATSNTFNSYILLNGDCIITGDFFRRKRYQSLDRKVFVLLTSLKLKKGQMLKVFLLLTSL